MLSLLRRIRYYFRRDAFERDLDEELRHHLALKAEAGRATPAFGNVTRLKEQSRGAWNWGLFEQLMQDLRYAARAMRANPVFTATAALSLALGIGANTAIYSFMDAILMRALPVQHAENLVIFHWRTKARAPVVQGINGSARRNGAPGRQNKPQIPHVVSLMGMG